MRRKVFFIPLFLALLLALIPKAYAGNLQKSIYTGGYWTGTYDVYIEVDFYLYSLTSHSFELNLTNVDLGEWHSWKIEDYGLYFWVHGNQSEYKLIASLSDYTETWLRLKISYPNWRAIYWDLCYADNDVIIVEDRECEAFTNEALWRSWGIETGYRARPILKAPSEKFAMYGINPHGNLKFTLKLNYGSFAISRVYVHSSMNWFTWIVTKHLDEEFNDDLFTQWDYADVSDFNYSIVQYESDNCIKFWQDIVPADPQAKQVKEWWEKVRDQIWASMLKTWNQFTSAIAKLLPKQLLDFFKWLWEALNWLWEVITLVFAFVFQIMPYLGLILMFAFIGAVADCVVEGDWEPLLALVRWLYSIAAAIVNGIATVVQTIRDFIKWW